MYVYKTLGWFCEDAFKDIFFDETGSLLMGDFTLGKEDEEEDDDDTEEPRLGPTTGDCSLEFEMPPFAGECGDARRGRGRGGGGGGGGGGDDNCDTAFGAVPRAGSFSSFLCLFLSSTFSLSLSLSLSALDNLDFSRSA
ncbi:hypothetical protein RFI_31786 [Reticulomyxa filosa]|uniref:Uncharacterized protein n=1 Tax=Reticulomyxa filosa TaxID=46433 RepID=X6LY03_RETFI|nr:hypothetical protein RFI_31786 [Reticulomyxa filosa]|eukprot:ETO05610.1 hypothetical protein RFI_31786 [Reticulomyxa filosa]